ncbi:hypothetical protein Golomagni_01238 [Golovinomyces magnicellulatus]|nr:hypothetical protein Golomagni_01238 [Golovinomyces magnicellulatus]
MSSLRNNPFRPALANHDMSQVVNLLPNRLEDNLTCYVIPNNSSRDTILDVAFACAGTIKIVKITPENLQRLRAIFIQFDEKEKPDYFILPHNAFDDFYIDRDLPRIKPNSACENLTYCYKEKSLYAHLALVIFLAGKKIEDINRTAITIARPKALIEKYRIPGIAILNGPAMISNHGHLFIHQAYIEMTKFTGECFKEFSNYTTSTTNLYQDIINVNVTLLRFANMQHAAIINRFIGAYPWVSEISELRQCLTIYASSVQALCKMPPALQPYVKLIYGDKSGIFPRKELGPLIACALEVEKEINETLKNYHHDDQFGEIVKKFRILRQMKNSTPDQQTVPQATTLVNEEPENSDEEIEPQQLVDTVE